MTYGTVANLKLRLNISGTTDDTMLGQLLDAASAEVDRLAGRSWTSGSATRKYGYSDCPITSDGKLLFLDGPVSAVSSITNGDGVSVSSAYYMLLPRNETNKYIVELKPSSGLYWWFGNYNEGEISVTATWVIPDNVTEAAHVLAEAFYRRGEESAVPYEVALQHARSLISPPSLGVV